jgi:hypothetical protein
MITGITVMKHKLFTAIQPAQSIQNTHRKHKTAKSLPDILTTHFKSNQARANGHRP